MQDNIASPRAGEHPDTTPDQVNLDLGCVRGGPGLDQRQPDAPATSDSTSLISRMSAAQLLPGASHRPAAARISPAPVTRRANRPRVRPVSSARTDTPSTAGFRP